MSSSLIPFSFESLSVRVVMIGDEPWWIAMDISGALGYSNAEAMTRRLDDDEIQNLQIVGFGNRGVTVINESGLYSSVIGSTKPEAKKFKKWVTSEVLPSIRKTGQYISPQARNALSPHLRREVQVDYTKAANKILMELGGKEAIVSYAIKNCVVQSGKLPAEWKRQAKAEKMPARISSSAKEVLRIKAPPVACGMSLADQCISGGATVEDALSIGQDSQPLFAKMLACGITPAELLL